MIGIDLAIKNINDLLTAKLWLANSPVFYGRVFEVESKDGIIPTIVDGDRQNEVLLDNKNDAQIFWRVMTQNKRNGEPMNVQLYVYANLLKLYPTEDNRDAFEIAARDISNVLRFSTFRNQNTIIGKESFSYWKGSSQNKHDMQPFSMFRIDGQIAVSQISTCGTVDNVTLTVNSGLHGIVYPSAGVYSYSYSLNNPYIIPINAIPATGYAFDYWLIDGEQNATALNFIKMYGNRAITPVFKTI